MRVGFALIVLYEVLYSLFRLNDFFSEQGFLPLSVLVTLAPPQGPCLFLLSRWGGMAVFLLLLLGAVALSMLVGYQTRWATAACWLLLFGLQQRNPYVLYGGDRWLLQSLFWCMFLPWGGRWSVDSHIKRGEGMVSDGSGHGERSALAGPAAACLLLQTALIYFLSGWEKLNPAWLQGLSIGRFLRCDELKGSFGDRLRYYPEFLASLTRAVPWLEIAAAMAILLPLWSGRIRALALGSLGLFHLALIPLLRLRTFSWVGLCVVIGLMPTVVWGSSDLGAHVDDHSPVPKWQWVLLLLPLNVVILNLGLPLGQVPSRLAAALGQRADWALFAEAPDSMAVLEAELELKDGQLVPINCHGKPRLRGFSWRNAYPDLRFRQYGQNLVRLSNLKLLMAFGNGLCRKIHRWNWESPPSRLRLYRRSYPLSDNFEERPPKRELILDYAVPDSASYAPVDVPLPPAGG